MTNRGKWRKNMPNEVVWSINLALKRQKILSLCSFYTDILLNCVISVRLPQGVISVCLFQSDCYCRQPWAVKSYYRPSSPSTFLTAWQFWSQRYSCIVPFPPPTSTAFQQHLPIAHLLYEKKLPNTLYWHIPTEIHPPKFLVFGLISGLPPYSWLSEKCSQLQGAMNMKSMPIDTYMWAIPGILFFRQINVIRPHYQLISQVSERHKNGTEYR